MIAVRDLLGLKTEIIGVGAAQLPPRRYPSPPDVRVKGAPFASTFADGLATREPNEEAIGQICRGAARIVEVREDAIAEAMRIYFDDTHQVAEGAGAAPLAALLQERGRDVEQERGGRALAAATSRGPAFCRFSAALRRLCFKGSVGGSADGRGALDAYGIQALQRGGHDFRTRPLRPP